MSFNPEGFEPFPSLYGDAQQIGDFAEWSLQALVDRQNEYSRFLERDDLMPRAASEAARILLHVNFELDYRAGVYSPVEVQ